MKEKSTKDQADSFFNNHLNSAKIVECKSQNNFFNLAADSCEEVIKLVDWECNRENLGVQLNNSSLKMLNETQFAALDERLNSGFEFFQCGQDSAMIYVQLVKKNISKNEASYQSGSLTFFR